MGDHWLQLGLLLLIGVLFFGAKRLPEMGSAVGKTIREFQKSMREIPQSETPTPAVTPHAENAQLTTPPQTSLAAPTASQSAAQNLVEAPHD